MKRKRILILGAAVALAISGCASAVSMRKMNPLKAEVTRAVSFVPGTDTGATSVTKDGVTATMTTMDNPSYYQIYANNSGTFSVSSGNITKIEFECTASGTAKYGPGNASADVGTYSYSDKVGTWTGSAQTITISSTAQIRMSSLEITHVFDDAAVITYTVNYDDNGATSGTVPTDDNEYESGDEVTVLGNTGNLAKDGYSFAGWNTKADGSGTNYNKDATFEIFANTTLYAQWDDGSLTFDLTTNPGNWPTSSSAGNYSYTIGTTDFTFALGANVYCNSGYLMLKYTTSLGLPAISGHKLTKVIANNSSGCSTSTNVGISSSSSSASYIDGGEKQTWSTKGSSYTYNLSNTNANTVYYLYVTSANAQVTGLTLTYEEAGGEIPQTLELDESNLTLNPDNGSYTLTATVSESVTDTIVWSSDNEEVATVDQNGFVEAVSIGKANIKAKAGDLEAVCVVTVVKYGTELVPLTIAEAKAVLDLTGTNVSAEPLYVGGVVSSNKAFDTTYHNGEIWLQDGTVEKAFELYSCGIDSSKVENASSYETANALRGCNVVAYGYGKIYNGTYELANTTINGSRVNPSIVSLVAPELTEIRLNKTILTLGLDDTDQLTATLPDYVLDDVAWSSDDEDVVTIDSEGNVETVGYGETVIRAIAGDLEAVCNVYVLNYGTEQSPLNITNASNVLSKDPDYESRHPLYVRGVVSSSAYNTQYSNYTIWLQSDDGNTAHAFELYRALFDSSITKDYKADNALSGCTVVAYGYGKVYNGTYELTNSNSEPNNPTILSVEEPVVPIDERIGSLSTHVELSYNYTKNETDIVNVTDTLDRESTGVTGTSYGDWFVQSTDSNAVYAGQSAGGNESIQLRATNPSGVVTTKSGGVAKKVVVAWNSSTDSGRTLDIYGKNGSYLSPADLYDNNKKGTKIGSIVCGTSTELVIEDEYTFIGIRSNDKSMYLDSIQIEWGDKLTTFDYSNTNIRFGGYVSKAMWDELDTNAHLITEYGILLSTSDFLGAEELKSKINDVDNVNVKKFYCSITAEKEHPILADAGDVEGLDEPYYIWNLRKGVSMVNLAKEYVAVAYIVVDGEVVFLNETKASAKSLARDLINDNTNGYSSESFEGSLGYLANY